MRRLLYLSLTSTLLLVGCGGTKPTPSPGSAASAASTSQNPAELAYKYADCMRQHGVSNFPDPVVTHQAGETSVKQLVTPAITGSPAFQTAQKVCASLMPGPQSATQSAQQQHQHMVGLLSFARCMRARGLGSFPDPNTQGQITSEALAGAGIDVHLPAVLQDAMACVSSSHGVLTRAAILQAVNRGG